MPKTDMSAEEIGVCQACHTLLDSDQIQEYGASFCHTIAVPDKDGDPEPAPCGPVIKYRAVSFAAESAQAAKYRAGVEALKLAEQHLGPYTTGPSFARTYDAIRAALAGLEG